MKCINHVVLQGQVMSGVKMTTNEKGSFIAFTLVMNVVVGSINPVNERVLVRVMAWHELAKLHPVLSEGWWVRVEGRLKERSMVSTASSVRELMVIASDMSVVES